MEETHEENSNCTTNDMGPVKCPHMVQPNKELLKRTIHALTSIKHPSTDTISLSLTRLEHVPLLDQGVGVEGEETNSSEQSLKHSFTNDIDNGKGPVYEVVVEPSESCETKKLCKSSENHFERRGKELENEKCMSEKRSANYSNTMDSVLQKVVVDINNSWLEDFNIVRLDPFANICDNSFGELHGQMITTKRNREREWSDSYLTRGSSPVLASLRASRYMA